MYWGPLTRLQCWTCFLARRRPPVFRLSSLVFRAAARLDRAPAPNLVIDYYGHLWYFIDTDFYIFGGVSMPKFSKILTSNGIVVLVPAAYYSKLLTKIRSNCPYMYKTRMYTYFLDSDGVMWRHPNACVQKDYDLSLPVERVISQWEFSPEVYMV